MKRKIIVINEELCNGCGNCITGCAEGALELVNGKAKLVKDEFCDGFGDCIGTCPTGALTIQEKNVKEFNPDLVKENLVKTKGKEALLKFEHAQKKHSIHHSHQGCPSAQQKSINSHHKETDAPINSNSLFDQNIISSELRQWPVQLHLVNPNHQRFKNREMVILSTCSPIASADVHWKYIRGRSVVVACPKLDRIEPYQSKLAQIFQEKTIPKVIILRMEVPCCEGLTQIAKKALIESGRNDLILEEHIMNLEGSILQKK